jgi:hypothetical protein
VFAKFSESVGRIVTPNLSKKKCKEVGYYYQFMCHYMHLHVNYKKLVMLLLCQITDDLTQDEKFFVKLVTKCPYLLG